MQLFLSSYINKIDKKGRVSIPAQFRNVLASKNHQTIITYQSFINNCIEACAPDRLEQLYSFIDNLDPFSEQKDAFATTILGGSLMLNIDNDGRVCLPDFYVENLGLTENVTFVGKGNTFELWNSEKFQEYSVKARNLALNSRDSLRNINMGGIKNDSK
ncbi:division/cell wall cluster transcriptional repressor MraZ [Rickettsiales endosymbiont of Stachyamoeba lipophora]|uniref:division/cell wall cluster transcriptional repressor MraZ n=1 Tax=Rickettsiales endosymbiont of Stachyamoeba lipophora TaxID=2486578 RepID=UPI000F65206D|nr:hypothetical protein [Rickettsiales endosymbiont of Stachyamoeba lipophora]AZL15307.1 hypothetical protein EF513_01885 [Rickettsiales endosymbiont of Stachyamoeba lipophora]